MEEELNSLYDPNNANISPQLSEHELNELNKFHHKAYFGFSPYAAVKLGYFIEEIKGIVYIKCGLINLNGHAKCINNFINLKESFHVVTPIIGLGLSRPISKNLTLSAEIVHALKRSKDIGTVTYKGYGVRNKISLEKTDIRLIISYSF